MSFPLFFFFKELLCKLKCILLADSCLPYFTPSAEVTLQEAEQGMLLPACKQGKDLPKDPSTAHKKSKFMIHEGSGHRSCKEMLGSFRE